jgi:hypothetical protein
MAPLTAEGDARASLTTYRGAKRDEMRALMRALIDHLSV